MDSIKKDWNRVKIHFICWAVYISYEILLARMMGQKSHVFAYVLFGSLDITLFYIHALYIMPKGFGNSLKLARLPFLLIFEIAAHITLAVVFSWLLDTIGIRRTPFAFNLDFLVALVWRPSLMIIYGTGYFFMTRYIIKTKEKAAQDLEVAQLKTQRARLEGDYLRAQITPHLLLNTLIFVKQAAKHSPEEADEAVQTLSDMLDFSLGTNKDGMIPLNDELRQVINIIRINELRLGDNLYIDYAAQLDREEIRVLPIILLTLVENLFKYGDLSKAEYPAKIEVYTEGEELVITTENLINPHPLPQQRPPTGLRGIRTRLREQYGDEGFYFSHEQEGRFYKVVLRMPYGIGPNIPI